MPPFWRTDFLRYATLLLLNVLMAGLTMLSSGPGTARSATPAQQAAPAKQPGAVAQAAPVPAKQPVVAAPAAPAAKPAPAAPAGQALPVPYAGASRQVITVKADCRTCTSATLQAWTGLGSGRYVPATGPVRAKIGAEGVGTAAEGSARTPLGTWDLPGAFGILANPGTKLPYFVAGPTDYWDGRSGLSTYNTHVRSTVPIEGENLLATGWVYNYAVVMGVNPNRVPYGGSAFFLHVTDGRPTAGCVAIDQASLVSILRWLDPAARPQMVVSL